MRQPPKPLAFAVHNREIECLGEIKRCCPACGIPHNGPFQHCTACKIAIDNGERI